MLRLRYLADAIERESVPPRAVPRGAPVVSGKRDPRTSLNAEIRRLKAALGAVHDALHAGEVDRAHELVECAVTGKMVQQRNLSTDHTALTMGFAAEFNALASAHRVQACCVLLLPSATVPGAVSLQMCGEVETCKVVESMLRGSPSTYMGDHAMAERTG